MRAARKTKLAMFENRVRFNWGYHDAAQAVREGWDLNGRCFAASLPMPVPTKPEDVLTRHFDSVYARGWEYGYWEGKAGLSTASSEPAWQQARRMGQVAE